MRLSKLLIPFLIMATAVACSSLFKQDDNGPKLTLTAKASESQRTTFNGDSLIFDQNFYHDPNDLTRKDLPPFKSNIEDKSITINGYVLFLFGGFIPEATLQQEGNKLTIRVDVPEDIETVIGQAQGTFYDLTLQNLVEGTYSVTIIHRADLLRGKVEENHTAFTKEFVIK